MLIPMSISRGIKGNTAPQEWSITGLPNWAAMSINCWWKGRTYRSYISGRMSNPVCDAKSS